MAKLKFNHERARGLVLGLAAGDKNRGPTQMALLAAESVLARKRFDLEDIAARWFEWWDEGAWDTGQVFDLAMQELESGTGLRAASSEVHVAFDGKTGGCNAAHRAPVLAAMEYVCDEGLDEHARALAGLTHAHVAAKDAAVFVTRLCRLLIREADWRQAVSVAREGLCDEVRAAVENAMSKPGGPGGYSPQTLQSALFFLSRSKNFESALLRSLEYAGLSNYCPVLVGAIAGARWGFPTDAVDQLRHVRGPKRLMRISNQIAHQEGVTNEI